MLNIAIFGASGAIGSSLLNELHARQDTANIYAFSRTKIEPNSDKVHPYPFDLEDENSIQRAAEFTSMTGQLDTVIVTTGVLHQGDITPEKSLNDLSAKKFNKLFSVNSIGPALIAKHILPCLKQQRSIFAVLSARIGSISDNQLGGWYAYRASKAALNMIVKTASVEMRRKNKSAIIVGLHPGTVDSNLSSPFQSHVPLGKLFHPDQAAKNLISVLEQLTSADSGKIFAWDGTEINY